MGFNYLSIVLGAHEEPAFQSSNDREEVQITFKALEDFTLRICRCNSRLDRGCNHETEDVAAED
ncbi:hypothetical protein E4U25_006725 [Claviceps purpurea]|nr:hypothetical protein E4U25_006725 [Claviceps purpurea]